MISVIYKYTEVYFCLEKRKSDIINIINIRLIMFRNEQELTYSFGSVKT